MSGATAVATYELSKRYRGTRRLTPLIFGCRKGPYTSWRVRMAPGRVPR
jgi:hypothetical protein